MKDILKDIVEHTQNLGFLTTVKITGEEDSTTMFSMADDRSVIMEATTHNPYPDMIGVFGMPQLQKLKYLLDGSEYQKDAVIIIGVDSRKQLEENLNILSGKSNSEHLINQWWKELPLYPERLLNPSLW